MMSKINQLQAAAVKAPVEKAATTSKPAQKKPAVTKAAATKAPIAKTIATKPVAKPVATKAPVTKTTKTVAKPLVKADVKEKTPKLKMERDSFTMPKTEYAQLGVLKERLAKLGNPAKKSELLRAGIMQLSAMTDAALKAAMSKVPTIKTGRPKKK